MYVRAVRQLAEHYHKSPDLITEEELRQYFLYIKNVKKYSRRAQHHRARAASSSSSNTPSSGTGPRCRFVRAPREKKLPVILSPEEVRPILGCVRLPRYRVGLTTIYSCGLRLQEGTHLQVPDIDSARRVIHIRHGKGGKDRYVPLPHRTLERLRQYWLTHRHPVWIFPAPGRGGTGLSTATDPMPRSSVQDAFRAALKQSGIHKRASVHTLRHSWATHLLSGRGQPSPHSGVSRT
jgi:integrase